MDKKTNKLKIRIILQRLKRAATDCKLRIRGDRTGKAALSIGTSPVEEMITISTKRYEKNAPGEDAAAKRCVGCNAIIPEERQVCRNCEGGDKPSDRRLKS